MAAAYGDIRELSPSQQSIISQIIAIGRRRARERGLSAAETRKAINTALAVGYTEARYSNPEGGDRDSGGWRQERRSLYHDVTNLPASINRFYDEYFADANPNAPLGVRAQQVQQSGTPHVWDTLAPLANRIRREFSAGAAATPTGGGAASGRGRGASVPPGAGAPGEVISAEHRSTLVRFLLTVVFVLGGIVIAGAGTARMVGLRRPTPAGAAA